tara:strand:- start:721 stop:1056 length:336 start_codon:yes stop_codon:yes gene_type:complete
MTIPVTLSGSEKRTNYFLNLYRSLLAEFKKEQTGYATIAIIGQSCLGSVAAMLLLMSGVQQVTNLVLLFFVTILCMAYNGAVLAQLKVKHTFNILLLSVIFSLVIVISHII